MWSDSRGTGYPKEDNMASIVRRGKKYVVVYYYTDEEGVRRQKWEPRGAADRRLSGPGYGRLGGG